MNEFDVIERFFKKDHRRSDIIVGNGDDCAAIRVPPDYELAFSMDTLVSGSHFLEDTSPEDIAYKALAVNLSDLAACGVTPRFVTLSLCLPTIDESWLEKFSHSFFETAKKFDVDLLGGDLVQGHLTITIQAHGFVPKGKFIKRSTAKLGDLIIVTGYPGHANVGLKLLQNKLNVALDYQEPFLTALRRPVPRVAAGVMLREYATSCIDISDGLYQDISHIVKQSDVGANLNIDTLPIQFMRKAGLPKEQALHIALTGGDDYELAFTLPAIHYDTVESLLNALQIPFTVIGQIVPEKRFRLFDDNDNDFRLLYTGFQHFQDS